MADNQYVNKVEYAGQTLMDLTGDTATPSSVLNGETFHDRSGAPQQGSLITHNVYDGLDSTSTDDALSANQGKVLSDGLTGVQNKTTVTQITPDVVTGIELVYNGCFRIGDIVVISARLSKTGGFPAGNSLLQRLPLPRNGTAVSIGSAILAVANNRNKNMTIIRSSSNLGDIYLAETIAENIVNINCAYITN